MFPKLGYIFVSLSAITHVFGEDPYTARENMTNTHSEAHTEGTATPAKSSTFSDALTRAYGDGLSRWGVDSAGEAEPSRTKLLSSQSRVSTMVLSDHFYDVDGSAVMQSSSQPSTTRDWQDSPEDIPSALWITGSTAHTTTALGFIPTPSSSSASLAAHSQESAGLAQNSSPPSDPEQTMKCLYYTKDGEYVQKVGMICGNDMVITASSSAPNTTRTSTSASNKTSTTTSSTGPSHVVSTTSAWDPMRAALNWLTFATTSAGSSSKNCKTTDSKIISTTDPAKVALDWLTSATTANPSGETVASTSTTTRDSRYSDDASAIVAELEATHTSYAASSRSRPGFW